MFLFFFFSSRRRHTRSLRDWSSDVCSSDLPELAIEARGLEDDADLAPDGAVADVDPRDAGRARGRRQGGRSEERRVGKRGGLGGGRIVYKKREERQEGERRVEGGSAEAVRV